MIRNEIQDTDNNPDNITIIEINASNEDKPNENKKSEYQLLNDNKIDESKPISLYFTGSFNPPTPAHLMTIVNAAIDLMERGYIIHKLYVSPSQDMYVGTKHYDDVKIDGKAFKRPRIKAMDRGDIFQNLLNKMKKEYANNAKILYLLNCLEINLFEATKAGFINNKPGKEKKETFVDHHPLVRLFQNQHLDEQIVYVSGQDLYEGKNGYSCCKSNKNHAQIVAPRNMQDTHTISSSAIMKADKTVMPDVMAAYSFYYPMLIDILFQNKFIPIANALLGEFIKLVELDIAALSLNQETLTGQLHAIEKNVGTFSFYQATTGHAEDIPFEKKPAQVLVSGLNGKNDPHAPLSRTQDGQPLPLAGNPDIVIGSFDPKIQGSLLIHGTVIDELLKSPKVYVNTDILPQGNYTELMAAGNIGSQNRSLQNFAVGICCAQKVHLLCDQVINAEGKAISTPRVGEIKQGDPALLLLSSPALNFSYGSAKKLTFEQRQYAIRGIYRNLFSAALAEGQTHLVMPAAGLGVFGGNPQLYFEILMSVAAEYPKLNIIYHPAGFSARFKIELVKSKVKNVVEATKDVVFIANELVKAGHPTALHNPSDADVMFGVYDVGQYWKEGKKDGYVGEEHLGAMTTAVLNSDELNPTAYQHIVERSLLQENEAVISLEPAAPAPIADQSIIIIEQPKQSNMCLISAEISESRPGIKITFANANARNEWYNALTQHVNKFNLNIDNFFAKLSPNDDSSIILSPSNGVGTMGVYLSQSKSYQHINPNPQKFSINLGCNELRNFFIKSFNLSDEQLEQPERDQRGSNALYFHANVLPVSKKKVASFAVKYQSEYIAKATATAAEIDKPKKEGCCVM